jgi:hypothetical protein
VRPAFTDAGLETALDDQVITINAKPVVEPPDRSRVRASASGPALKPIGAVVEPSSRSSLPLSLLPFRHGNRASPAWRTCIVDQVRIGKRPIGQARARPWKVVTNCSSPAIS